MTIESKLRNWFQIWRRKNEFGIPKNSTNCHFDFNSKFPNNFSSCFFLKIANFSLLAAVQNFSLQCAKYRRNFVMGRVGEGREKREKIYIYHLTTVIYEAFLFALSTILFFANSYKINQQLRRTFTFIFETAISVNKTPEIHFNNRWSRNYIKSTLIPFRFYTPK